MAGAASLPARVPAKVPLPWRYIGNADLRIAAMIWAISAICDEFMFTERFDFVAPIVPAALNVDISVSNCRWSTSSREGQSAVAAMFPWIGISFASGCGGAAILATTLVRKFLNVPVHEISALPAAVPAR